jgi:hypothetical protein
MSKAIFAAFIAVLGLDGAASAAETCPLPSVADTVALNPVPGSDLMTVPVEINGKPKQFLLNLSTNRTEVSQAAVAELGLPESAKAVTPLQYGGGDIMAAPGAGISVPVYETKGGQGLADLRTGVRIGTFTIGRATGRNLQFVVSDDKEMGKSKPYDGLLTNDFFKQYDVELDFGGKAVSYLTPTQCADPNLVAYWSHFSVAVVPMTITDGRIEVPVTIDGHAVNAVIDTSSQRSVMRRDIAELTFGLKADAPGMMPAGDLKDGLGQPVYGHTFPRISLQDVTAANVPVLIQTNSMIANSNRETVLGSRAQTTEAHIPDLTIGMDVLHQLHLYIVFGQKKIYVTSAVLN